jgi:hypothetical protein
MRYLLLVSAVVFVGCATSRPAKPEPKSSQETFDMTKFGFENFKKYHYAIGPTVRVEHTYWHAKTVFDTEGTPQYSVRVTSYSGDWKFLNEARLESGAVLKTSVVDKDVHRGGVVEEQLVIDMPTDVLENARQTGMKLKLYGKRGNVLLEIPGWYIDGYLSKIATAGNQLKSTFGLKQ